MRNFKNNMRRIFFAAITIFILTACQKTPSGKAIDIMENCIEKLQNTNNIDEAYEIYSKMEKEVKELKKDERYAPTIEEIIQTDSLHNLAAKIMAGKTVKSFTR